MKTSQVSQPELISSPSASTSHYAHTRWLINAYLIQQTHEESARDP